MTETIDNYWQRIDDEMLNYSVILTVLMILLTCDDNDIDSSIVIDIDYW